MLAHLLADCETDVLIEILGVESQRLMVEPRRTDASAMRKEVRKRLGMKDGIADRFQEFRAGNYEE